MFLSLTQDITLDHVIPLAQYNQRVSIENTGIFNLLKLKQKHRVWMQDAV